MTLLLSLETATDVCAVAVSRDGRLLAELILDEPRRHAERLVAMVDEVLAKAGLGPADLSAVAISAGPGSYTGLRIGASTAKGLAFALSIPLVPVPSLLALAASVDLPMGTIIVAAFGARRGEVYAQAFRSGGETLPAPLAGPVAGSPGDVLPHLVTAGAAELTVFLGDGADLLARAATGHGLRFEARPDARPTAAAVARVGDALLGTGASVDADAFEPYYLREFTAKLASGSIFDRLPA